MRPLALLSVLAVVACSRDAGLQTVAANRSSFAIGALTDAIVANQQAVADRLGLILGPIVIRDAVWLPPES